MFFANAENLEQLTSPIDPSYQTAMWKMALSLLGIIVLAFFFIWLYRRYGQSRLSFGNNTRLIKVLERKPLSQKTMLYILEIDGKQLLIAESQAQVSHLQSLDWNKPEESKL